MTITGIAELAYGLLYLSSVVPQIAANSVRLFVRNSGRQVALGMNQVKFNAFAISQIRELADALVERMLKYIQKVASEYPNDVPNDGEYLIDLKTGTFRRL